MKIGIIGFGNFGQLAASILAKKFTVQIYDSKGSDEKKERTKRIRAKWNDLETVAQSDVVILCVPISQTEKMIKKIAPMVKKGALILDTCSVKVYPCRWLEENLPADVDIVGTHPMFGPNTTKFNFDKQTWNLKDLQLVLCPLRTKKVKVSRIIKYLTQEGIKPIITSPEDHDKQNARTLSLVHFLGRSLIKSGVGEQQIYTPGYADLLKILPHTTGDNWQLFYDMNNYNPYAQEMREKFLLACESMEEKIERSNEKNEIDHCRKMIDKIDYKFIELLTKRFEYVKKIGAIKKKNKLPIVDKKREALILRQKVRKSKLNKSFLKNFYELIFKASYKIQK
jgi:prephenate dehydrogenase